MNLQEMAAGTAETVGMVGTDPHPDHLPDPPCHTCNENEIGLILSIVR